MKFSTTATLPLLLISLVILTLLLHPPLSHIPTTLTKPLPPPTPTIAHPHCFIYDRPPRTGSTTISKALNKCLKQNNFTQPPYQSDTPLKRPRYIRDMLHVHTARKGVYTRHLSMHISDGEAARKHCAKLLYITSIRPMAERLWSAAKYGLVDERGSELKEGAKERMMKRVEGVRSKEGYYERYPYQYAEVDLDRIERLGLTPDYVIRSERMEEDLGGLLEALGCERGFESRNRHVAEGGVEIEMGDRVYRRLGRVAERVNGGGLRKAREFRLE